MSWRDNLLDASYKGVPFYVKEYTKDFGRRTELKQFPNNDSPSLQDFGQDASEHTIDAYVIANKLNDFDYFETRDALINAFNEIGIGELVHPYLGTMQVYPLGKAKLRETTKEGGIAYFHMRFVEVNEQVQKLILPSIKQQPANITIENLPTETEDFNALIDSAVELADNNAMDNLANAFEAARAAVNNFKSTVLGAINKLQSMVFRIQGAISGIIGSFTGILSGIVSGIDNIINAPCSLFNSIRNAGNGVLNICGIGQGGLFGGTAGYCSGVLRGETTYLDGETIPATLGSSVITEGLVTIDEIDESNINYYIPDSQIVNTNVTINTFKYMLLSTLMRVCIRTNFLSSQDAIKFALYISNAIDSFLTRLGDQEDSSGYSFTEGNFIDNSLLTSAVTDLRKIFIQAMYAKASDIASAIDYKVTAECLPTMVLAYDKYEDLNREQEILNINSIRHPGFLPSGQTIRILDE
jgi:prophage DNA circulation protein